MVIFLRYTFTLMVVLLWSLVAGAVGVPVTFHLPTDAPLPHTYRVTLAIVDKDNPDWIISQFVSGGVRTVTAENNGAFTETWDGLDDNFMPVPPGSYGVKGIYMPAEKWQVDGNYHSLTAKYLGGPFCWLPSADQDMQSSRVHGDPVASPPGDIATDGTRAVFTWSYLENGTNNFIVDLTKPIDSKQISGGWTSGGAAGGPWTAFAGGTVWTITNDWRNMEHFFIYRGDRTRFTKGHQENLFLDGTPTGLCAWRDDAGKRSLIAVSEVVKEQKKKVAAGDIGETVTPKDEHVRIFDGDSGESLATLALEKPSALKARNNRLYALHQTPEGWAIVSVPLVAGLPQGEWQQPVSLRGITAPTDFDLDAHGRIYVCDSQANHVYRLATDGTIEQRWGAQDEQTPGHYDLGSFMRPARIACWTTPNGEDRVIVLEQAGPSRIAEWSSDGKLVRAWQTLQAGANDGWSMDPLHPEQAYMMGNDDWLVRYRIDFASGQWTVNAVWPNITNGMNTGWAQLGSTFFPKIINRDGRRYLAFSRGYMVYRFDDDKLLPSAGIIKQAKGNQNTQYYLWTDSDGNGKIDETEWREHPLTRPSGIFGYFGDCWQSDLSLLCIGEGTPDIWQLTPEKFDRFGNPIYNQFTKLLTDPILRARAAGIADALHGGNEVSTTFDCAWRSVQRLANGDVYTDIRGGGFSANYGIEQKLTRYVPDGHGSLRPLWRVGRCTNICGGEGITGSINMSAPYYGLIGVIDQTRAGVHVYTADTGMYVDTLLADGSQQWNNMYGSPGEFFAGNLFQRDNKVYIAFGKTTPLLYEVRGWSTKPDIRQLTTLPAVVAITADKIADPPALALQVRGGAGQARVAHFLPAVGEPPALDGSLSGWEACEPVVFGEDKQQIEARGIYDRDTLYLRWKVRSEQPINVKELQPANRLFTHDRGADTVSVYLQGDPTVAGTARDGRPGDVRFIAGLFKQDGQTVPAVLGLYPHYTGTDASPCTYTTPVGKVSFEHVGLVTTARSGAVLDPDGKGFVLAVAIPRSAIPADTNWTNGWKTAVNFDANFGGNKKLWWSYGDGSANRETNDEPTEARFYPGSWAQCNFAPLTDGLAVRKWQAIGPFCVAGVTALDLHANADRTQICKNLATAIYPPQEGIDLAATYRNELTTTRLGQRTLRWLPAVLTTKDKFDFTEVFRDNNWRCYDDEGTAYMATWIYTPNAVDINYTFSEGNGDHGVRGWLNGTALPSTFSDDQRARNFEYRLVTDKPLALTAGWNMLLLRIDIVWGDVSFGLRLHAPPDVLWSLKVANQPPAKL